ncbi:MAG: methyl-accepting chemotaxis protein [bacterium]
MFVTFKSRLYFAAILMFIVILIGDFIVINYINTFKNSSNLESVISSSITSFTNVQKDVISIIYLSKLRKANIKIAKLEKKTFNTSSIDKNIAQLVKKIKMARVNNIIVANGFMSGFSREKFSTVFGVKKQYLHKPVNKELNIKMLKFKKFMAFYRPHLVKILKNPIKAGPTISVNHFKKYLPELLKNLNYVRSYIVSSSTKRIHMLLDFFMVLPFFFVAALLLISYYFKKTLLDKLGLTINKIGEVAKGDLRTKIKISVNPKNEIGLLVNHVNILIDSLTKNVSSISQAVESVSSSSTELDASSLELENSINNMKQSSSSIVESIKQLTLAIIEIAKNSSNGAQEADYTQKATEEGYAAVQNVIKEITLIEKSVDKAADVINELGESSQKIGEIIAVIDEIADQTNLLALNAAIEAARAGEQGRGFAVVADEVRKLAERTTKATKEITDMISSIQEDTLKAVESMNYGKEEVKNGVSVAKNAGYQINKIKDLSVKLKDMITLIATAAEEQSTATEEISASSESILQSQESATSSAKQVKIGANELSKLASELSKTISIFKIK